MRSAITTLKLKEVSTVNGMFPELQTALSIFQKQVAIAGNGFPFTLFQDFFSTFCGFCRLTPNGCTFEFPMGTSYESGASTERGEAASSCHTSTFWVHMLYEHFLLGARGHWSTEGQHRPKAGKKKKTREAGFFFLVPTSL